MNNFYSLVKIGFNSSTNDTITIGVLFSDGKEFSYFFSAKMKKFATRLAHLESKDIDIDFLINQIVKKSSTSKEFDEQYFLYLSNYCNGLLQFSAPNPVAAPFTTETLEFLVQMNFSETLSTKDDKEEDNQKAKKEAFKQEIQKNLIEPLENLENKIHTHYKFEPTDLPITFSFELDCIGKNGVLIGAKAIDFENEKRTLNRHFSNYLAFISTLSNKYKIPLDENSFFWIAEEPKITEKEKHQIWEIAHKHPLLKVVEPNEVEKIVKLVEQKQATRFL